jgi:neutral ceramidase
MRSLRRGVVAIGVALLVLAAAAALRADRAAAAPKLKVGVGRADITPPTGYDSFGYVRADGRIEGALSRLWAKVIVLEQGNRKLALVAEDLGGIPGGMLEHAIARVADRGFSVRNVLNSATHTHSGPTGFFNFPTYNTVFMSVNSPTDFDLAGSRDPRLYSFMVDRLATAIRRADRDLGPGRLGWGRTKLVGPTVNRSLEAHLRNHGLEVGVGAGTLADDPLGADHTLESSVDVLRVDRRHRGRWIPAGLWTNFANHGTVVKYQFRYYNRDHHGSAADLTERQMRRRGKVPFGRRVVTVYGNGAEGDQSAGLEHDGPAGADEVGREEGREIMRAWERAGERMRRRARLGTRWTRMCFCGQQTAAGRVAEEGRFGLGQFTGSDEARGPLYDVTRVSFEGWTAPDTGDPQGRKVVVDIPVDLPTAVPLTVARIGDRLIGTIPGEPTKQTGARTRKALIRASAGSGVKRALISGLTNEFTSYYATAEEYDAQHYEGAATLYGRATAAAVEEVLAELAAALAVRRPAPAPHDYDQTNGVADSGGPYPEGAEEAQPLAQPDDRARRLGAPTFSWRGGPRGYDRPLDRAFIRVQRKAGTGRRAWRTVDRDNNGLRILWYVDDEGRYTARWEPALGAPLGTYRFQVRGRRYRIHSDAFELRSSRALEVTELDAAPGRVAVALRYPEPISHEGIDDPPPDVDADLTARPKRARKGFVRFLVDGRRRVADPVDGRFEVAAPADARVEIAPGAARDRHGNRNGGGVVLRR